jgi:hypothetical protein
MVDREPFEVDKVFKKHVYVKNPIHPSWRRMGNNLLIFFKSKEEALKAISLRVVL